MSGAEVLLELLVLAVAVAALLGHWRRVQGAWWALVAVALTTALAMLPQHGLIFFLGRPVWLDAALARGRFTLLLDDTARAAIRGMLALVGVWGVAALLSPVWGRGLPWLGLGLLGGALAAMTVSLWALGWAMAMWAATALLAAFGGQPGTGRPVWQWLLPWVAPVPLLFALLIWPDPNRAAPEPWRLQVLAAALIAWSALFPLHVGYTALSAGARPAGATWAWWSHTVLMLALLRRVGFQSTLGGAVWQAAPVLQFLGVATLVWAGLAALSARDVGRLAAYAGLYNWALTLIMWLAAPEEDVLVRWTLTVRFLALGAVGLGLAAALHDGRDHTFEALSGWARRRPWSVALWAIGTATLAGAPFTPGAWGQWMVHRLPVAGIPVAWAALLGGLGIMAGVARALVALWGPLRDPLLVREEGVRRYLLWGLTVALVIVGLLPHVVIRVGAWLW